MPSSCRVTLRVFFCALLVSAAASAVPVCDIADFSTYQLQYCRYPGEQPALVLESGMGRGMDSWPPEFIERLNRSSEVLIYNRIGYGKSHYHRRHPRGPLMARESSRRLHRLLDRLYGDAPVVLVGHSLGGLYAQYFARAYAAQTAALVLLDAANPFEPAVDDPFEGHAPRAHRSLAYLEWKGAQLSQAQMRRMRAQERLAASSPRGRFVVAEGSGHDVYADAAELVAEEIERLLREEGLR